MNVVETYSDDCEADEWSQAGAELTGDPHERSNWLAVKMAEFEKSGGTVTAVGIGCSALNPESTPFFNRQDYLREVNGQQIMPEQDQRTRGRDKVNAQRKAERAGRIAIVKLMKAARPHLTPDEVMRRFNITRNSACSLLREIKKEEESSHESNS